MREVLDSLLYLFCTIFGHKYHKLVTNDPKYTVYMCTRCGDIKRVR